jgi:hypothetical protein
LRAGLFDIVKRNCGHAQTLHAHASAGTIRRAYPLVNAMVTGVSVYATWPVGVSRPAAGAPASTSRGGRRDWP